MTIRQESLTSKCRRLGVTYGQYKYYEMRHPELTTEQIDKYFRQRLLNGTNSFKAQCERVGINYDTACQYRARHKDVSQEDTIKYFIRKQESKENEKIALEKCKRLKIPVRMYNKYRQENKDAKYQEIINMCLDELAKRPKTFKAKCEEAGINYSNARHYKVYHPDLTDEQIIVYYLQKKDN